MEDIEVDAEVFKVIRANIDCGKSAIIRIIKKHLPELNDGELQSSLERLMK